MPLLRSLCLLVMSLAALASRLGHAAPTERLGEADARHLLARTGFGPTASEIRAFAPLTRAEAVERLFQEARSTPVTPVPVALADPSPLRPPRGDAPVEERQAFVRQQVREGLELRAWWLQEMLATPSPLTERMTLFWHNHFASAQPKVRITRLMYRQNVMFREHALGDFGTLLHAAAKDPAMLIYLDGVQNRRGQPNENFAREVMELFTLGEGHYTQQDIKEAARAFTGWSLDRKTGTFRLRPLLHDPGSKTVLGKRGAFDGDAVLDILLAQPATAEYIVARLWRELASPEPDPDEVMRIARAFRASNYEIKVALRGILTSDAFYATAARGALVKSPVELVVGTLRQLEIAVPDMFPFALAAASMGQNVFSPPNVKGWTGGEAWINTSTLLARKQFLERLTRLDDAKPPPASAPIPTPISAPADDVASALTANADDEKRRNLRYAQAINRGFGALTFDSTRWVAHLPGATPPAKREFASLLLVPVELHRPPPAESDLAALLRAVLLDPAFQLK